MKTEASKMRRKIMQHLRYLAVLGIMFTLSLSSVRAGDDPWAMYRFLIGEWVGEGSGEPGQGAGGFTFQPDLQGKVLVRKNWADYPAAGGRPAFKHEDLLVVYKGEEGKRSHAIYFDSEDHVIRYTVSASEEGKMLTFVSEPSPRAPRFRLTYRSEGEDKIGIKFEIAPPGKPEEFKPYIEAKARKKK
jgi:hypothetical protein